MSDQILSIQNVYQRALALERRIRLSELFPEGVVPYLKKLEYDGAIASPHGPSATVAPPVTKSFDPKYPLEMYSKSDYCIRPENSMLYIGKMDGYAFNTSIPKFDPWFRTALKERDPNAAKYLEDTYVRDPCTPDRVMQHMALFDRYWKRKPTGQIMKTAERILERMFEKVGQVEPIDFNYEGWHQILPHLDMSSSPGLPLRREYSTQGECLGHIYDKAKRLNHFAKFLAPPKVRAPPCMIGLRPGLLRRDELDTKIKARGVWAYPAEVKVLEMRFCIPLLARLSRCFGSIPYPVGRNLTKALPFITDHLFNDGKFGLVTDISKLDTSVGPDYIHWAFAFMKRFFNMGYTQSSVTRNENVFEFLKYYFLRTPILLPSGQLVRKIGGVPSGSGFTQLVDTFVTLLASVYSMLKMNFTEADILGKMFAVGDDMAASVPSDFSVEEFTHWLATLGFIVNPSKVMFSNKGLELKFLGYFKNGGNIFRPDEELLQTAFFPEKFVGNADRSRQRILGQTIASGLCSGMFSKFNQWLGEPFLGLPFDPGETYIPQKRWMRNVLGLENLPSTTIVFDLFHLV